jgi:hypothetical protein
MRGKPVGNVRLGRRFTPEELNDPAFLAMVETLPICTEDHGFLMRFGGTCECCGKAWGMIR